MSLTRLIKDDSDTKLLFKEIPNLKKQMVALDPIKEAFSKKPSPVSPSLLTQGSASVIGTAFDFFFRAWLQRLNHNVIETEVSDIAKEGLENLREDGYIDVVDYFELLDDLEEKWALRTAYASGKDVSHETLAKAVLFFTYLENYYRTRHTNHRDIRSDYTTFLKDEINDLVQLMENTEVMHPFFNQTGNFVCNPTFGENSARIGGADADFLLNGVLWDIKTTKDCNYKGQHLHQLIGYYILATEQQTEPLLITHIGIYYSRYNHGVILPIEELKKVIDFHGFVSSFYHIVDSKKHTY